MEQRTNLQIKLTKERYMLRNVIIAILLVGFVGCSGSKVRTQNVVREVVIEKPIYTKAPGVQEGVWEEPMVDSVTVPPGLDPEGHYYRPEHDTIVEIRQGRWTYDRRQTGDN